MLCTMHAGECLLRRASTPPYSTRLKAHVVMLGTALQV